MKKMVVVVVLVRCLHHEAQGSGFRIAAHARF